MAPEGKGLYTLEGGDPNDLPQQISMMADTVVLPEMVLSNFCDEFKKANWNWLVC